MFRITLLRLCFLALACLLPHVNGRAFWEPETRDPSHSLWQVYQIADERAVYEWANSDNEKRRPHAAPCVFNWITRRTPCLLVSGDVPRFALFHGTRTPSTRPEAVKLGDLRIRLNVADKTLWLDEAKNLKTTFYPWGTIHRVSLAPELPLSVEVQAFLIENRGIGIQLALRGEDDQPVEGQLDLVYGGLVYAMSFQDAVPYYNYDPKVPQEATVTLVANGGTLSDPKLPFGVTVATDPAGTVGLLAPDPAQQLGKGLVIKHDFKAGKKPLTYRLAAWSQAQSAAPEPEALTQFDAYFKATKDHYKALLDKVAIDTPDTLIDTGFYAGVVNLDYIYEPGAWLEGIHNWNSYFAVNYQISAAIALGQFDRARQALLYFGDHPDGPGHIFLADGKSQFELTNLNKNGGRHSADWNSEQGPAGGDDQTEGNGYFYYVTQLYRYWKATGDSATVARVWKPLQNNLARLLKQRDPETNLLINWNLGANMFLYQADHLSLPGDAFSPSVMLADSLEKLAEMGQAIGKGPEAGTMRRRADIMYRELVRRLWSPERGRFIATIDTQGLPMEATFYTDFIYPSLYSRIPAEYGWIALRTMRDMLWVDDLARVGNLLPDWFGNNNIMGAQTAETAEAYLRAGRPDEGCRILSGTARGATVYTASPGSFPERMSIEGYGMPDYGFGNPIGSYLRAVVGGLFGLEQTTATQPLVWRPSIPADWPKASLRIGDIALGIEGKQGDRTFNVTLKQPQALDLRLPLLGQRIEKVVSGDGRDLAYTLEPHPSGGFIHVLVKEAKTRHTVRVITQPDEFKPAIPAQVKPGEQVAWTLPAEGLAVIDPQRTFKTFRIDGATLTGEVAPGTGPRTFFLTDRKSRIQPVEVNLGSSPERTGVVMVEGNREALSLEAYLNSDSIPGQNLWIASPCVYNLSKHVVGNDPKGNFRIGDFGFRVKPDGKNILALQVGVLEASTNGLKNFSAFPDVVTIPVGKAVKGLDIMTAAESRTRLTGMQVGTLKLRYADGFTQDEPLVYGKNINGALKTMATDVVTRELEFVRIVSAFGVKADPTRTLESIEFSLHATDTTLGIFAINLVW